MRRASQWNIHFSTKTHTPHLVNSDGAMVPHRVLYPTTHPYGNIYHNGIVNTSTFTFHIIRHSQPATGTPTAPYSNIVSLVISAYPLNAGHRILDLCVTPGLDTRAGVATGESSRVFTPHDERRAA